jgi:hypothetical protein
VGRDVVINSRSDSHVLHDANKEVSVQGGIPT